MALEFGFYDSYNHDRLYDAQNMNDIFEGVITDGVYAGVGDMFFVKPSIGLQVTVGTGRAWFKMTWNKNRTLAPVNLDRPDPVYDRIDTICIRARKNVLNRMNDFFVYKGNILVEAQPPVLVEEDDVFYLPLANVRVRANAEEITPADIEILVGRERCPFVTSILQQTNIKDLYAQWQGQFEDWWKSMQDLMESLAEGDISIILNAIESKVDKSAKATEDDISGDSGYSDSKWMTPKTTKDMITAVVGEGLDDIEDTLANGVVSSFNGRKGPVMPQPGDYSAEDVSALPISGGTLTGNLVVQKGINVDENLAVTGTTILNSTVTMQGGVRLQSASSNYGSVLNFGDSDYVHISEPSNNAMEVKANSINFVLSGSAGYSNTNFKINGTDPFAQIRSAISSAGSSYTGLTVSYLGASSGTASAGSNIITGTGNTLTIGSSIKLLITIVDGAAVTSIIPWHLWKSGSTGYGGTNIVISYSQNIRTGVVNGVDLVRDSSTQVYAMGTASGATSLPAYSFSVYIYGVY